MPQHQLSEWRKISFQNGARSAFRMAQDQLPED
jgi:hypothetical protein